MRLRYILTLFCLFLSPVVVFASSLTLTYAETDIRPRCSKNTKLCAETFQKARYNCQVYTAGNTGNTAYYRECFCYELTLSSSCSSCKKCNNTSNPDFKRLNTTCEGIPRWKLPTSLTPLDAFLPWQWTVRFNRSEAHDPAEKAPSCPSAASNLAAFAAVNIVTAITIILLRKRSVTDRNTNIGLQILRTLFRTATDLIAHGINAYQIRRIPGFASIPFGGLILLWTCQPRIAWFDVFSLLFLKSTEKKCYPKLAPTMGRELLLEIVALVYMGIAMHFASRHGYFQVKADDPAVPSDAKLLYGGATLSMVITVLCLAFSTIGFSMLLKSDRTLYRKVKESESAPRRREPKRGMLKVILAIYAPCVGVLYMATWIFWAGFIKLSGDLYCPPELSKIAAVWGGFSVLGLLVTQFI